VFLLGSCKKDSATVNENVVSSKLHTPVISYPVDNYIIVNKNTQVVSFRWDMQYNIHHYEITIAEDSFFNNVILKQDLYNYYFNQSIDKPISGELYWKVIAYDSLGYSTKATTTRAIFFKSNTEVAPEYSFNSHVIVNDIFDVNRRFNITSTLNNIVKYEIYSSLYNDFLDTITNNHNLNAAGVNKLDVVSPVNVLLPNDLFRWDTELKVVIRAVFDDNTYSNWCKPIYFKVIDPTIAFQGNYKIEYYKIINGVNTKVSDTISIGKYNSNNIGQGGVFARIDGHNDTFSYYNCQYKVPCENNPIGTFTFSNYPGPGGYLHFSKKNNSDSIFVSGRSSNVSTLSGYKSN